MIKVLHRRDLTPELLVGPRAHVFLVHDFDGHSFSRTQVNPELNSIDGGEVKWKQNRESTNMVSTYTKE